MDAPFWEEVTRVLLAVATTLVFAMVAMMTALVWRTCRPSRWVALFMSFALASYATWRWFVVWLGLQHDESFGRDDMAVVTTANGWLLLLLIVSVGLMAFHHARELRKGRNP